MKSSVATVLILVFTCSTTVSSDKNYDPLSALEIRGFDPDYKLQMPFHGLLQKFATCLKNIFTLHRGKLDELKGKLDTTFDRVSVVDGKLKEYETSYQAYPSKGSCACPSVDQIYGKLKEYPTNFAVNLKLFQLVPLWGKVGRLEQMIYQNHYTLRNYLNFIQQLESHNRFVRPRKDVNVTGEIERYLHSVESVSG
ncbi:uncharacterized protein LOC107368016 [Tetranychus urticae]|uniref:Prolyl 4-hydroxylase alpha-subunit N-terminal domain-containing protein n=1 Tax=Tetranychus urticae TaxID=32264 RepID=T1KWY9_TETUR|nr:uncharacterized protein LOC107368016 [Tetranychus urticae]